MESFTEERLNELVKYLNRRYSYNNGYVSGIVDTIDEWAEEHNLKNDVNVEAEFCRSEEITDGLWEYVGVDGLSEDDYDSCYFIIDITVEDGSVCVYVAHMDDDEPW